MQDFPEYNAILGLSMVATFNLLSLLMIGEYALGTDRFLSHPKLVAITSWCACVAGHYFMLVHGGRAKQILAELSASESPSTLVTWAYFLASIACFLGIATVRLAFSRY